MSSVTGKLLLSFVVIVLVGVSAAFAQTKRINVKFRKGATSGTYSNTVTGNGYADFYVTAKGGQEMSAKLTSANKFLYFLIIRDPANPEAIADDARDAVEWSGELPENGTIYCQSIFGAGRSEKNQAPR